jgi:hypothetical protein
MSPSRIPDSAAPTQLALPDLFDEEETRAIQALILIEDTGAAARERGSVASPRDPKGRHERYARSSACAGR